MKTELVSQEFVVFWGEEGVNGGKLPFYYVGRPAVDADTVYDQYFRSGVTKRVGYKKSRSSTSSSTKSKKPATKKNARRFYNRWVAF